MLPKNMAPGDYPGGHIHRKYSFYFTVDVVPDVI